MARRFPVISLREINADDLGSSRKSSIWLLLDPVFGLFPCIFPADLGFAPRDGFATDWNLRQAFGGLSRPLRPEGSAAGEFVRIGAPLHARP